MKISTKILFYILSSAFVTFLLAFGVVGYENKQQALDEAKRLVETYAREYANLAADEIHRDVATTFALTAAIDALKDLPADQLQDTQNYILEEVLRSNPTLFSTWVNWELSHIKAGHNKNYGRRRFVFSREGSKINRTIEELDLEGDDNTSQYYRIKLSQESGATNPYAYSYNKLDSILEISIWKPLLVGERFLGVVGVDVSLERYEGILAKLTPYDQSYVMLIANNGSVIASGRGKQVGENIENIFPATDLLHNLQGKVRNGQPFSAMTKEKGPDQFLALAPVPLIEDRNPWSLAVVVPSEVLVARSNQQITFTVLSALVGLVVLGLVVLLLASSISKPLNEMADKLNSLERGVQLEERLNIRTRDEIGEVARSVNRLIDTLNNTAKFAYEIGQGKLDTEFELQSADDTLGKALLEMRENLLMARVEEEQRQNQERQQVWIQKGIADSGIILRQGIDRIDEFGYNIVSFLVKFIEANQGGFFVYNDFDPADHHIELVAAYAFDRRRIRTKRIELTEGLVSRAFYEKEPIYLTNIPESYFKITSGFGEKLPTSLIILPQMFEDQVYGVIEIASFDQIEPYKQQFLIQVSERIGAFLANLKKSIRTNVLLENSQKQAEELIRSQAQYQQQIQALEQRVAASEAVLDTKSLFVETTNSLVAYAMFSPEGFYQEVNDEYLELYGADRSVLLSSKHDNVSIVAIEDPLRNHNFWLSFASGIKQRRIEKVIKEELVFYIEEYYSPMLRPDGSFDRVLCIAHDITEYHAREQQYRERAQVLRAELDALRRQTTAPNAGE